MKRNIKNKTKLQRELNITADQVELLFSTLFKCMIWDEDYARSLRELFVELREEILAGIQNGQTTTEAEEALKESLFRYELAKKGHTSLEACCQQLIGICKRPLDANEIQRIFCSFQNEIDYFASSMQLSEKTDAQKWKWFEQVEKITTKKAD